MTNFGNFSPFLVDLHLVWETLKNLQIISSYSTLCIFFAKVKFRLGNFIFSLKTLVKGTNTADNAHFQSFGAIFEGLETSIGNSEKI